MKALVYTGPEVLEVRDVPEPDAPTVVAVDRAGICGSDMHAYLGHDDRRPAPLILGHEAAGTVGDRRVTINPLVTCGQCPACLRGATNLCPTRQIISMPPREGAFAERVAIPEGNLIDTALPFAKAALAEPLAVCWHAARLGLRLSEVERAIVLGGGAIGVGSALALAAMGVEDVTVVEPNPLRRATLGAMGLRAVEAGDGPTDLVVDAVGYGATRATASGLVRPGGAIVHVGLGDAAPGLDVRRLTLQEIAFLGTYAYTADDFRDTVAAMEDGRLGALDWTEERPLSEGARAFADIRAGKVAAPKVLLVP
ncbi:alcohol dehydrogenase catalytic domain-containing protein [Jannaschia sp. Os4]|uniref:alcohol dehydrogenase catalytic domain-containing protein n=1 Tax=Jannaschia sp. Os4 TaxID=2807617 RepID=UPI00193A22E3|nr:alcohol dehydrogenase catalytic domain-containing protein [Jannaschia sp. Os4]